MVDYAHFGIMKSPRGQSSRDSESRKSAIIMVQQSAGQELIHLQTNEVQCSCFFFNY